GTFVVTATRNGFLYSEQQFEIVDCAKPPACLPNGQVCSLSTSCCSGYCSGSAVCEARLPPAQCKMPSQSCASTKECCSGECVASRCQACAPLLTTCQATSDCCTGYCGAENKCVLGSAPAAQGFQFPQVPLETIEYSLTWLVLAVSAYSAYRVSAGMVFFPIELGLAPIALGMLIHPVIGIAIAVIELVLLTKSGLPSKIKKYIDGRRNGKGGFGGTGGIAGRPARDAEGGVGKPAAPQQPAQEPAPAQPQDKED
ncbi:MAG TPA: hypothetical protein PLO51_02030, partial [Candidatus Micrarchaeota archaeon]|nr:hypothetical protein [Candidatus Micrarchaeota archaeon]